MLAGEIWASAPNELESLLMDEFISISLLFIGAARLMTLEVATDGVTVVVVRGVEMMIEVLMVVVVKDWEAK